MGRRVNNSFESEVQEIVMVMQHVWSKGYQRVIFESDCKKVIDTPNHGIIGAYILMVITG